MKNYKTFEGENFYCKCGNQPHGDGYFPCDKDGNNVEPTPEWGEFPLYVCAGCREIYLFKKEGNEEKTMNKQVNGFEVTIKSDTVENAMEEIKEVYQTCSSSMSDILGLVNAPNLCIEQIFELYAQCMIYADEDYVVRGNINEGWAHLIGVTQTHEEDQCELNEIGNSLVEISK